jgi:DNA-binding CsgD family transcriptional regulator
MPFELGWTCSSKAYRAAGQAQVGGPRNTRPRVKIFQHLGAPLWENKARQEPAKIATRGPVNGLTETEHRVATLIIEGPTNREVATAMFVTENTMQAHLLHIFQKLAVRSRTELAAQLLSITANTRGAPEPLGAGSSSLTEASRTRPVVNITDSGDSSASAWS